ncbi:MAG: hypothetical protein HQL56_02490 [Magnetococcales bacterium]|nr:hypothetical protein [Magnetococcales bacterium]
MRFKDVMNKILPPKNGTPCHIISEYGSNRDTAWMTHSRLQQVDLATIFKIYNRLHFILVCLMLVWRFVQTKINWNLGLGNFPLDSPDIKEIV